MLALVAALFAVLLWAPPVAAEALGAEVKRALEGEKHIYVATRRADGTWSRLQAEYYPGRPIPAGFAPGSGSVAVPSPSAAS